MYIFGFFMEFIDVFIWVCMGLSDVCTWGSVWGSLVYVPGLLYGVPDVCLWGSAWGSLVYVSGSCMDFPDVFTWDPVPGVLYGANRCRYLGFCMGFGMGSPGICAWGPVWISLMYCPDFCTWGSVWGYPMYVPGVLYAVRHGVS